MQARERLGEPGDGSPIRGLDDVVSIVRNLAPPVVYAEPEPIYPELFQRLTEKLHPVPVLPYTEVPEVLPPDAMAVLPVGHEAPGQWKMAYHAVDLTILVPSSPSQEKMRGGVLP